MLTGFKPEADQSLNVLTDKLNRKTIITAVAHIPTNLVRGQASGPSSCLISLLWSQK